MVLIAGLVLVSYVVFTLPEDSRSPALFYTLVPFLLWSALRFGWLGVSTSLVAVTFLSIWGAVHGRGPFSDMVPLTDPFPLQMFLLFASIIFMVLAAVAEQQEQAAHVVRESEERFRHVANTAPVMIWMVGTDRLCTCQSAVAAVHRASPRNATGKRLDRRSTPRRSAALPQN